ncbi:hypothetical protein KBA41_08340 [Candidatus Ozemobacteraceae bacterium]|nr:hypothetical protein [Candidatus Ozemobacteraceae bacterium]
MKIRRGRPDALLVGVASSAASLSPLPPGEVIYGLKPPATVPFDWWSLLADIALFWFGVWLLFRITAWWRRRSEACEITPLEEVAVDHRQEALDALARLKSSPVWGEGRSKDICESLAGILKTFLQGRYSIGTGAAATTDELMQAFPKCRVPVPLHQETLGLLTHCDEVKYARGSLGALTLDELWNRFQALVVREDWRR